MADLHTREPRVTKPMGPVSLYGVPEAQGLKHYWLMNEGAPSNPKNSTLRDSIDPTRGNATFLNFDDMDWRMTPVGPGWYSPGTASRHARCDWDEAGTNAGPFIMGKDRFSVMCVFMVPPGVASSGVLYGEGYMTVNKMAMYTQAPNSVRFYMMGVGSHVAINSAILADSNLDTGEVFTVISCVDQTGATTGSTLYFCGNLADSDARVTSQPVLCSSARHGHSVNYSTGYEGVLLSTALWDRCLTPQEVYSLAADPWRMFRPEEVGMGLWAPPTDVAASTQLWWNPLYTASLNRAVTDHDAMVERPTLNDF